MDYIYGKLNKEVQEVSYKGGSTDSAVVTIDHNNKTIYVDTKTSTIDKFLSEMSDNAVANSVVTKRLEEIVNNQTTQNDNFTLKLLSFSKVIDNAENEIDLLTQSMSSFIESVDNKVQDMNVAVSEAQSKLTELENNMLSDEDINQISKNTQDISALASKHTSDISSLTALTEELKQDINNISESLQSEGSNNTNAISLINDQLEVIRNDIELITDTINDFDFATKEEVTSLALTLNNNIVEIQGQLQSSIEAWDEGNELILQRIGGVENTISEINQRFSSLEEYIRQTISETTQADIAKLQDEDEALQVKINLESVARSDADTALSGRIDTLETDVEDILASVSHQAENHSKDMAELKEYVQSMDNSLSQDIRDDLEEAKKELADEFSTDISNLQSDHAAFSTSLSELDGKISKNSFDIAVLTDELEFSRTENDKHFLSIEQSIENANVSISEVDQKIATEVQNIDEEIKSIRTSLNSAHTSIVSINRDIEAIHIDIENANRSAIDNHNKLVIQLGNLTLTESQHYNELLSKVNELDAFIGEVSDEDSVKIVTLVDAIKELHAEYSIVREDVDVIRGDIEQEVNDAIDRFQEAGFYVTVYPVAEGDNKKYVYTSEYGDVSKPVVLSNKAEASAVVMRDSIGNIAITTTASYQNDSAVPKQYVDTNIKNAVDKSEETLVDLVKNCLLIIDGGTSADLIKN